MVDQGSGWQGPDADEMYDVGRGDLRQGMLATRNSGAGREFRHQIAGGGRPEPSLALMGQTVG